MSKSSYLIPRRTFLRGLGASLARLEIRTFFDRLRRRVDHLERLTDEPHIEMPNAFVFGLKESHVAFT